MRVPIFAQEGHESAVQGVDLKARLIRQLLQQAEPSTVGLLPHEKPSDPVLRPLWHPFATRTPSQNQLKNSVKAHYKRVARRGSGRGPG